MDFNWQPYDLRYKNAGNAGNGSSGGKLCCQGALSLSPRSTGTYCTNGLLHLSCVCLIVFATYVTGLQGTVQIVNKFVLVTELHDGNTY